MDPTIAAAIIAGGISALVAVASFLTTRSMTLRQLAAARQDRLWDKQAATYADAIAAIQWQQARRRRELSAIVHTGRLLPEENSPVDWGELQGRLFAFASPEVLVALKAAGDAGNMAESLCLELDGLIRKAVEHRQDNGEIYADLDDEHDFHREIDSTDDIESLMAKAQRAMQSANDKDDALIDVIRADLQGNKGRALGLLSPRKEIPK